MTLCSSDPTYECLAATIDANQATMDANQARLEGGIDVFYHIFAATMGKFIVW